MTKRDHREKLTMQKQKRGEGERERERWIVSEKERE